MICPSVFFSGVVFQCGEVPNHGPCSHDEMRDVGRLDQSSVGTCSTSDWRRRTSLFIYCSVESLHRSTFFFARLGLPAAFSALLSHQVQCFKISSLHVDPSYRLCSSKVCYKCEQRLQIQQKPTEMYFLQNIFNLQPTALGQLKSCKEANHFSTVRLFLIAFCLPSTGNMV